MKPFPWEETLKFGLGILKLSSNDFWDMTPKELSAAYRGMGGGTKHVAPPTRDDLDQMQSKFPDSFPNPRNQKDDDDNAGR